MPRGTAFDLEVFKTFSAKELKAVGEEARATIWTPETGKRFRLCGFTLFATVESVFTLEDGTTAFFVFALPAKGTVNVTLPGQGYLSTTATNKLQIKDTVTSTLSGCWYGVEE